MKYKKNEQGKREKHTEPYRVDVFFGHPGKKEYYFNSYAEAMAFAKAKTEKHLVFLMEHMMDGMYCINREVKEDEN